MKWGIALVVLIIAGSMYYFWSAAQPQPRQVPEKKGVQLEAQVSAPQEKYIPPGAVMEDGTI